MRIIIDTNIYLNFYRLTNDQSLKLIDQLIKLINDKKIELILTHQIRDEFYRDKNIVFKEYLNNLNNAFDKDLRVPKFLELNKKSKDVIALLSKTRKALTEFKKEYWNRVLNSKSTINKKVESLFRLCTLKEETKEILEVAYYRTIKGNPPRKSNSSFGDAIIWETILKYFCEDDLIIISGDGDFESDIKKGEINEFLFNEFNCINKKNVKLYKNLGEFINTVTKKQTITKKIIIKEKEINNLSSIKSSGLYLNDGKMYIDSPFSGIVSTRSNLIKGGLLENGSVIFNDGTISTKPISITGNYGPTGGTINGSSINIGTSGPTGYIIDNTNLGFGNTGGIINTKTACPNCGAMVLNLGSDFCSYCGKKL